MPTLTVHVMASCCFQDEVQALPPRGIVKGPTPSAPRLLLNILPPAVFSRDPLFPESHPSNFQPRCFVHHLLLPPLPLLKCSPCFFLL